MKKPLTNRQIIIQTLIGILLASVVSYWFINTPIK